MTIFLVRLRTLADNFFIIFINTIFLSF